MKSPSPTAPPWNSPTARRRRDAAQAIGPRLAKAAVAARVNGTLVDTSHACSHDGDTPRHRHGRLAGGPRRHAPLRVARHGAGHPAPVPGHQVRHRPDHRERLLLRLPVPGAHRRGRPGAHREGDGQDRLRGPGALERRRGAAARGEPSSLFRAAWTSPSRSSSSRTWWRRPRPRAPTCRPSASTPRASSPTSAAGRTCPAPASSATAPSSSPASPAPTGAATRRTPCSRASTAPPGPSKEELAAYLEALELARQRDHRRIGRDLDLFSFHEEGPGFPFFHPKGMRLWNAIIDFWRAEHVKAGYEEVRTPHDPAPRALGAQRPLGQLQGRTCTSPRSTSSPFAVKPMNCPGGLLIYKSRRRSYRDLPLRMAELGQVHRHEMSGVLHGLFRVRYFTQDDAHIYCTPEQLEDEVLGVVRFMHHIYAAFGFTDVQIELSTRPEKSDRLGRDVGARRERPRSASSRARASTTSSTPATAPSTAPRSTSTSATSWAAPGSAAPSRSTSPCPSGSTSPTPGPTTKSIGR